MTLTLSGLRRAVLLTEDKATPHRIPDFNYIDRLVSGDPVVRGFIIFYEEYNTGYDGYLLRWMFTIDDTDTGKPIRFMADLLPGLISISEIEESL